MKTTKMGTLVFLDAELKDMMDLGLMDLVACGQHGGRWDLSCLKCALRYETGERIVGRIATRLQRLGQEIPIPPSRSI